MAVTSIANSSVGNYKKSNSMNPENVILPFSVEYLVIAGGGAGGRTKSSVNDYGAGAGGGGYRSSVSGEDSGGGDSAESAYIATVGDSLTVTIGSGGSSSSSTAWTSGSDSVFDTITSLGGGWGGGITTIPSWRSAANGGSGGGQGEAGSRGSGESGQGFAGGIGGGGAGAGGGGAGGVGGTSGGNTGGAGGVGVSSLITGTSVGRAGGGSGWGPNAAPSASDGGGRHQTGLDGAANTGGGGGAGGSTAGGNGGSGVVILKYPATRTISVGAGLTSETTTVGDYKVTEFTAGTDTVQFS